MFLRTPHPLGSSCSEAARQGALILAMLALLVPLSTPAGAAQILYQSASGTLRAWLGDVSPARPYGFDLVDFKRSQSLDIPGASDHEFIDESSPYALDEGFSGSVDLRYDVVMSSGGFSMSVDVSNDLMGVASEIYVSVDIRFQVASQVDAILTGIASAGSDESMWFFDENLLEYQWVYNRLGAPEGTHAITLRPGVTYIAGIYAGRPQSLSISLVPEPALETSHGLALLALFLIRRRSVTHPVERLASA